MEQPLHIGYPFVVRDKSDIQRVVFMMGGKCMLTVDSVMYFAHKIQLPTNIKFKQA